MIRRKADSKNGETVKEGYAVQPDRRSAGQGEVKRHIGWKILSVQDFAINISDLKSVLFRNNRYFCSEETAVSEMTVSERRL